MNSDARPIYLFDVKHFEGGIAGLILALARWWATKLLTANPFKLPSTKRNSKPVMIFIIIFLYHIVRFIQRIISWCFQLISRLIISLTLFLIPLILLSYYVYQEFFKNGTFEIGLPLLSFLSNCHGNYYYHFRLKAFHNIFR